MTRIQWQYFLLFHMAGTFMPFMPVFLRDERGFSNRHIGIALALASAATLVTPAIATYLGDSRFDPRRIAAFLFVSAALALVGIGAFEPIPFMMLCWVLFSFAFASIQPLGDGIAFSVLSRRKGRGLPVIPYHRIRVWGTFGFILPSVLVYLLMRFTSLTLGVIVPIGVTTAVVAAFNILRVEDPQKPAGDDPAADRGRMPTREAARVLFSRRSLPLCAALALSQLGSSAFFGFYAIYMAEVVAVEPHLTGLIFNIGVVIEIAFMLGFATLRHRIGLRGLIACGLAANALRLGFLALYPTVLVAIAVQVFHGFHAIATLVAPQVYINSLAGDRFRNSIQGLYVMSVHGVFRIIGSFLAGILAEIDLVLCYMAAAAFSSFGALIIIAFFKRDPEEAREAA